MTNRENPVWQIVYAVEFAYQLREHLRLDNWPDDARLVELGDDARAVADAAVEALGEPQPASAPQPRDESKDVWVDGHGNASDLRIPDWKRYVPYAQLEDYRRDSELLDAILEAYDTRDIYPGPLADTIKNAVAERAKL